jgi:hypothetical protein
MARPTTNLPTTVRSAGSKSGSPILKEKHEHLFQHIKQSDPMLYEALRRIGGDVIENATQIENIIGAPNTFQDKATFGLVRALTVDTGLTLHYICRQGGTFIDTVAKIRTQAPTGTSAILDIKKSIDDGLNWNSIFPPTGRIVLPAGSLLTVRVFNYTIKTIAKGDLLRIDCLQIGSTLPGKGVEVVTRFRAALDAT